MPWRGCPVQNPELLAAPPWPLQACLSWMLSAPRRGKSRVLLRALYIAGLSPGVRVRRQRGLTVSTLAPPSWLPCSEPSSHLLAWFAPVPLVSPARWVPVMTPCSMVVVCVFPPASTSTALELHLDMTAHPMSEPLQILPANNYANYLISCLIYFLCRYVFCTSPSPGGCGSPGLGGSRSSSGTHTRAGCFEILSADWQLCLAPTKPPALTRCVWEQGLMAPADLAARMSTSSSLGVPWL